MVSTKQQACPPSSRCTACGADSVSLMTIPYEAEAKRHGKLYKVLVPRLTLPVCRNCGAKYFTIEADDQINAALTRIISVAKAFEAATAVGE